MDNWIENSDKTRYVHRYNAKVVVAILPNLTEPHRGKYFVFHAHPAPHGSVPQPLEGARDMASARKKAEMHMRHWNDPTKWKSDPDYGKMGQMGK